jgi:hypothetical protein
LRGYAPGRIANRLDHSEQANKCVENVFTSARIAKASLDFGRQLGLEHNASTFTPGHDRSCLAPPPFTPALSETA